ncbi:MAG: hypothetical protein RL723_961 [Actinomycetota bacterium]
MAKKSKIAKNEQRKVIVERYAEKRLALKKALVDPQSTDAQREEARLGLQKLPTAMQSMAAHVVFWLSSVYLVFASATWLTKVSCQVSPSLLGKP